MYEIRTNKTFRSTYKRICRSGKFDITKFEKIVESLRNGEKLPKDLFDHALTGNLFGQRECHIEGDILLQYEVAEEDKTIRLTNIGNHANMFGS